MPGFPNRPVRAEFGPDPVNRRPVRDPEQELDASVGRLIMWQLSGLGLTAPRAWVDINCLDPTPAVLDWAAAWDPRRELDAPVVARTGAGVYTVAFEADYPDESGAATAFELFRPRVWVPGAPGEVWAPNVVKLDALTVQLELRRWNAGIADYDSVDGQEAFLEIF